MLSTLTIIAFLATEKVEASYFDTMQRAEDNVTIRPVFRDMRGEHFLNVWIGKPKPQLQSLIIETRDGITALPCSKCKGCNNYLDLFKEKDSSTFSPLDKCPECQIGECVSERFSESCQISRTSSEGISWTAYEAKDEVYIGGPFVMNTDKKQQDNVDFAASLFWLTFACQEEISDSHQYRYTSKGTMGMDNTNKAVWAQMYKQGIIDKPAFSLCFAPSTKTDRESHGESSEGSVVSGVVTFGGSLPLQTKKMVFATNLWLSGFFSIRLKGIYLRLGGGNKVQDEHPSTSTLVTVSSINNSDSLDCMIDSGKVHTRINDRLKVHFLAAWDQIMDFSFEDIPYRMIESLDDLPTIIFQFEGSTQNPQDDTLLIYEDDLPESDSSQNNYLKDVFVAMPPQHYLTYNEDINAYQVAILFDDDSRNTIFGSNFMQGHEIYFDTQNRLIGFAENECDYASITNSIERVPILGMEQNEKGCENALCSTGVIFGYIMGIIIATLSWKISKRYSGEGTNNVSLRSQKDCELI